MCFLWPSFILSVGALESNKYQCAKVALESLSLATRCSSQKSVPIDYIKPSLVVYSPAQTFPVVLAKALAHTPLRSPSVKEVNSLAATIIVVVSND